MNAQYLMHDIQSQMTNVTSMSFDARRQTLRIGRRVDVDATHNVMQDAWQFRIYEVWRDKRRD